MNRHLVRFVIVGLLSVAIDYASYRGLARLAQVDFGIAKGIGFVTGAVFAYAANRWWTFADRRAVVGSVPRFVALYLSTLAVNVAVNTLVLRLCAGERGSVQVAFVIATGLSALLNFLGMRAFVFARSPLAS